MKEKRPLKYLGNATVVFEEFPDEVCLAVNISDCPCCCDNCSEPELRPWVGNLLTNEEIDKLLKETPDVTVFGLMGGDSNYEDVCRICDYIHEHHKGIKVGIYSGRDWIDMEVLKHIDLYKIGRWIDPYQFGDVSEWHKHSCGPLVFSYSNQLLFEKQIVDGRETWVNTTYKFRKIPVNNPEKFVIRPNKETK